jgi:hypothetical protein
VQLLEGYTQNGAYQLRLEDELGSIETGKLCDTQQKLIGSRSPFFQKLERESNNITQLLLSQLSAVSRSVNSEFP